MKSFMRGPWSCCHFKISSMASARLVLDLWDANMIHPCQVVMLLIFLSVLACDQVAVLDVIRLRPIFSLTKRQGTETDAKLYYKPCRSVPGSGFPDGSGSPPQTTGFHHWIDETTFGLHGNIRCCQWPSGPAGSSRLAGLG